MKTVFHGKRISGILSIVPETAVSFDDEVNNYTFPAKQTMRLKKVMGYKQHRIVKETTATSDFCVAGLQYILDKGWLKKEDIGGIIVATSVPDHFVPPVSSIIHGKFGLDEEVFCVDISQGCTAFCMGLAEAFMLLDHMQDKKVVLFASDVLSKKTSKQDRNSYPLVGDAAGIAVVENDPSATDIYSIVRNRGDLTGILTIPAGGSRLACSPQTAELKDTDNSGNLRSLDNLSMQGQEVFVFAQKEVPPIVHDVLDFAGLNKEEMDLFLLHQPNRFMLRKIAERIGIPYEKVPMNLVENFGNSSGACIPLSITYNFSELMKTKKSKCVLCAFGSGLTWSAMTMDLGEFDFCEMLQSNL